jgi:hypothetical protein
MLDVYQNFSLIFSGLHHNLAFFSHTVFLVFTCTYRLPVVSLIDHSTNWPTCYAPLTFCLASTTSRTLQGHSAGVNMMTATRTMWRYGTSVVTMALHTDSTLTHAQRHQPQLPLLPVLQWVWVVASRDGVHCGCMDGFQLLFPNTNVGCSANMTKGCFFVRTLGEEHANDNAFGIACYSTRYTPLVVCRTMGGLTHSQVHGMHEVIEHSVSDSAVWSNGPHGSKQASNRSTQQPWIYIWWCVSKSHNS